MLRAAFRLPSASPRLPRAAPRKNSSVRAAVPDAPMGFTKELLAPGNGAKPSRGQTVTVCGDCVRVALVS